MIDAINCPYCGAQIQEEEASDNIWQCHHCSHAFLVETQTAIQPIQSTTNNTTLIKLGSSFIWRAQRFTTHGFLSFSHSEGVRREWLITCEKGDHYYLLADDESFFLLQSHNNHQLGQFNNPHIKQDSTAPSWESLQPNTYLNYAGKDWIVTEQRRMTLQESSADIPIGDLKNCSRNETYLIAGNAETLMLLFTDDAVVLRQGFWLDPFEIVACT